MCPSHILAGFGCLFLGYSHDVSPFSGDTRLRATALFFCNFKILQRTKRQADRLLAARAGGGIQVGTAFMAQPFA